MFCRSSEKAELPHPPRLTRIDRLLSSHPLTPGIVARPKRACYVARILHPLTRASLPSIPLLVSGSFRRLPISLLRPLLHIVRWSARGGLKEEDCGGVGYIRPRGNPLPLTTKMPKWSDNLSCGAKKAHHRGLRVAPLVEPP